MALIHNEVISFYICPLASSLAVWLAMASYSTNKLQCVSLFSRVVSLIPISLCSRDNSTNKLQCVSLLEFVSHLFFVHFRAGGFIEYYLHSGEVAMTLSAKTKNISIILYKPKYAGNVGSVARAAKNMGISKIVVVGTSDLDREAMEQRSTHLAADVLDALTYFETIEEALGGFQYIVGTTARLGKARGPFVTPRAAANKIADLSQKNKIALLFGPEDTGLANDQLRLCHSVVTIPTSREFTSLNLSQAVMILCYEIFTASSPKASTLEASPKLALSSELEGMYGQIRELLGRIGFLNPENPEYWMLDIRRFFSRAGLLSREVKIIRGICRQLEWQASNKKT